MDKLTHWLIQHPLWLSFGTLFVSCLVSIYSSSIRRFIREWPANKFKAINQRQFAKELALLQRLHNDTYQLTLFFIWNIASVVYAAAWWTAIFFGISWVTNNRISPIPISSALIGVAVGKAYLMRQVVERLLNYDHSIEMLRKYAGLPSADTSTKTLSVAQDENKSTAAGDL